MQDFGGSAFGDEEMQRLQAFKEQREKEGIRKQLAAQARGELAEAYEQIEDSIVILEAERKKLSAIYVKCESMDSPIETQIGNSLVLLRKSIAQFRKSAKELLQPRLPMGEDEGEDRPKRPRHLH